jgi:hypothetical protein
VRSTRTHTHIFTLSEQLQIKNLFFICKKRSRVKHVALIFQKYSAGIGTLG